MRDDERAGCRPCGRRRPPPNCEEAQPDEAEQQDAVEQADQPHVQPHVAVEHVAELVPDHALQLVAVEPLQRPAGDGDRRVGRRVARGEGVDAVLLLEHEHARHRHAGRDRHLLDDVDEPAQLRVASSSGRPARRRPTAPPPLRRRAARSSSSACRREMIEQRADRCARSRRRRSRRPAGCGRRISDDAGRSRRRSMTTARANSTTSLTVVPRAACCRSKKFTGGAARQNCTFGASRTSG